MPPRVALVSTNAAFHDGEQAGPEVQTVSKETGYTTTSQAADSAAVRWQTVELENNLDHGA